MFPGYSTRLENDIVKFYKKKILGGKKDAEMKIAIEIIVLFFYLF